MGAVNRAWKILSDTSRRSEWDAEHPLNASLGHWAGVPTAPRTADMPQTPWRKWPMPHAAVNSGSWGRIAPAPRPASAPPPRSRLDSGWLAASVGVAIVVAVIAAAGIAAGLSASRDGRLARGLPPADGPPPMQRAVAGYALVVPFNAAGSGRLDILGAGAVTSETFSCAAGLTQMGFPATTDAQTSFVMWNAHSGTYAYVWKTDADWAQSCRRLVIEVDGATQAFYSTSARVELWASRRRCCPVIGPSWVRRRI